MPRIEGTATGPGQYAPQLTVRITVDGVAFIEGRAVVDSGADMTLVPGQVMEALGVDFASLPPPTGQAIGAGGAFEARPCRAKLYWRQWEICDEFQVSDPGSDLDHALLRRDTFFKKFIVRFTWHHNPPWFQVDPVMAKGKPSVTSRGKSKKKPKR